jgi:hypothetical protein
VALYRAPVRSPRRLLGETAGLFLSLGITGYGGPSAHIALTPDEVVQRSWLDDAFDGFVGTEVLAAGDLRAESLVLERVENGRKHFGAPLRPPCGS